MSDLCSIVVATYNQAHFLRTSLLSCLNQTYPNCEIIVVPVQGDLETFEVLREFKGQVRVIISEKADYVYQRNLGIENADGEWITLADSDDAYLMNKVASEIDIGKRENALIVSSAFFTCDENLNIRQAVVLPQFSRERLLRSCIVTDLCMVHKSIYKEFGLFDESYGECAFYEKWLRVAEKYPDRIKINPTPTFLYRTHPKQMHVELNPQWQMRMRQRVKQESLARKPL